MTKKSIINRLIQIIIMIFGISFFTFSLIFFIPGDPILAMYAENGVVPNDQVLEAMRMEMGLDNSFFVQYFSWLGNCLRGDFGNSFLYRKPVVEVIYDSFIPTLNLAIISLALTIFISLFFGVISAMYKNKFIDFIIKIVTFIGISLPNFCVGLLLIYFISVKFKFSDPLILSAITLSFSMSSKYIRQIRVLIIEELNQDYVLGARARGINNRKILTNHIFPNIKIPLITLLGLSLGSLLGGTAVVEIIFSYAGLGNLAVSAMTARDYPLILGYVLFVSVIYMFINLLVDIWHS